MPCEPPYFQSNLTTTTTKSVGSAPSDGLVTPQIWVVFQGKRFGPYWNARDARKEGFILDEEPMDRIPLGGWRLKWPEIPEIPKVNG